MSRWFFHSLNYIIDSVFHTKAINFDGSTESMRYDTATTIGVANAHSMITWLKASSTAQGYAVVIRNYNVNINNIIQLVWASNKFEVWLYNSTWTLFKRYITNPTYSTNTIYQVVYTWDWTTLTLYVNGASVAVTKSTDSAWTQTDSTRKVYIGSNVAVNNFFNWIVSKVDMWNSTLSSAEISSLYDSWVWYKLDTRNSKWSYTSTANLKHQWALGKDVWSNIGYDYVASGQINVSNNSVNITDADITNF